MFRVAACLLYSTRVRRKERCYKIERRVHKKLSFILQEIGREINTTGSKAYDADIQKCVVIMKNELEKIKEQLANIL